MQELPITPKQMAKLIKLAGTPQGKRLLELLQKSSGPALREALGREDYEGVRRIVSAFLSDPEAAALMRQLGG